MTRFTITLASSDSPAAVWRRLGSTQRHTAAVPLTRVTVTGAGAGGDGDGDAFTAAGAQLLARTALGPFGFDDTMLVERAVAPLADQPGELVLRKTGRVVTGSVRAVVAPVAGGGSAITWTQDIGVLRLPGALVRPVAKLAYAAALRRIVG